jgi:hypothetical protein
MTEKLKEGTKQDIRGFLEGIKKDIKHIESLLENKHK